MDILSLIAYRNFRKNLPYFNDKMNKFYCIVTGNFLWQSVVLTLCKILEHTEFNGALQIYFMGLPLIIGLIIFEKDTRKDLLLKKISNIETGEEAAL